MKYIFFCLLLSSTIVFASKPTWTVSPTQYEYSMNVTAVLNEYCSELANDSNILGAFINGTCVGVVRTSTVVGGRNLAYLLVYSNISSNQTVQFQFYNALTDTICTAINTLTFSDNAVFGSNDQPIEIYSNLAPTSIALSSAIIPETDSIAQVVGTLSCTDPGKTAYQTYSLISGTGSSDNGKFIVTNNQLILNTALNYYLQDSLHIRLQVTDKGGCSFQQSFTLGVQHEYHSPTALLISDSLASENRPAHTLIGVFSAINYDKGDSYKYALVAGIGDSNNTSFTISGDSLYSATSFNFEKKSLYGIRVQVTDNNGGGTFSRSILIIIKNDNDPPASIVLSKTKVYELLPVGSYVATLNTIDKDGGENVRKYTYTFDNQGTNDNGSFIISNDTLKTNAIFHFATKSTYTIYLTSTDTTMAAVTNQFIISIKDTLETPTGLKLSNDTILYHQSASTFIGTISTIDNNGPSAVHNYSLVADSGSVSNGNFYISNDSLYSANVLYVSGGSAYTIRIRTTLLNNLYYEHNFTIHLKNQNPTLIALSNNKAYELLPIGTIIGELKTTDNDTADRFTYALANVGTNDNTSFVISNDTLKAAVSFNYHLKKIYNIYITSTDSVGSSITLPFTVNILDTLETPTGLTLSNDTILYHKNSGTFIGTLSTIDDNGNASHFYTLSSDTAALDNQLFTISNDSLFSASVFNFAAKSSYTVRIRTTLVNKLYYERNFSIHLKNQPPTAIVLSANRIYEHLPVSSFISTLTTIDKDPLDGYSYSLSNVGTNDNTSFIVSGDTLKSAVVFDYYTKNTFNIYLTTTDSGGSSVTKPFTIYIRDTLNTPTGLTLSYDTIYQHKAVHTFIGTFSTIDNNGPTAQHTYSLVVGAGSNDNSSFLISGDSLYSNATFDFETKSKYAIRTRTTLVNQLYFENDFTIFIKDNNYEKPHAFNDSASVKEGSSFGTLVLTLPSATDSDKTTQFTYQLIDATAVFSLDAKTGELTVSGNLDFHKQNSYVLRYKVLNSEVQPLSDTATIKVTILPVEENILPVNNYVSPNGDGKNDYFQLISPEVYSNFELTIYNSTGVVVYQKTGYNNEWNGSGLNPGVYYYTFIGDRTYKGNIVLVK